MRIIKKKMETTIFGLYRVGVSGWGLCKDKGKENGNYYNGLYTDSNVYTVYKGYISFLFLSSHHSRFDPVFAASASCQ